MAKTLKTATKIVFGNKEKKQFPDPEGLEREKPSSAIEGSTQPLGFETRLRNKFSEAAPPMPGAKQTLNNRLQRVGSVRRGVTLAAPRKEEVDGNMENKTFTQFVTEAKRGRPRKLRPGEKADTEHLQDQLSKLTHPNHVIVHFADGTKHQIPRGHANKALQKLASLKPEHRAAHVEHMHSSHENFYKTLAGHPIPSKKKTITLAGPKLRKEEAEVSEDYEKDAADLSKKYASYAKHEKALSKSNSLAAQLSPSYRKDMAKRSRDSKAISKRLEKKATTGMEEEVELDEAKDSDKPERTEHSWPTRRNKQGGWHWANSLSGGHASAEAADRHYVNSMKKMSNTKVHIDDIKPGDRPLSKPVGLGGRSRGLPKWAKSSVKEEAEQIDELSIYKMQAVSKEASRRNKDYSDPKGIKHQVYGTEVADEKIKKKAGKYNPSTAAKVVDKIKDKLKGMSMKKKMAEEAEHDDDGWYAHKEMHGKDAVSKEDWKKGIRKKPTVKKEEVEQIDEISKKLMVNYMTKADKEVKGIEKRWNKTGEIDDAGDKQLTKRVKGMNIARDKFYGRAKVKPSGIDRAYDAARQHYKAKGKIKEEVESDEKKKKDHHKLLQKFRHRIDEIKAIKGTHATKLHAAKVIHPDKVGYAGKQTKPKVQNLRREDYAPLETGEKQDHVDQKTVDAKSRKQGAEKPKKPKMEMTKEAWALYDTLSDKNKAIFEKMDAAERDALVDKYISGKR